MASSKIIIVVISSILKFVLCTQYVVLPKDRKDQGACDATTKFLNDYLQPDKVKTYRSDFLGITKLWLIDANQDQVAEILKEPNVLDVVENQDITKNTLEPVEAITPSVNLTSPSFSVNENKPTDEIIHNPRASKDLATVSWRPGRNMPRGGSSDGYYYESRNGRASYVYLIDNGIDTTLSDFRGKGVEWYFMPSVTRTKIDSDPNYHGSCVLSKAAGNIHGVSPDTSHLVIIKTSQALADNELAFFTALEDIYRYRRESQSVILYARTSMETYQPSSPLPSLWGAIKDDIKELLDAGVPIVTTAGPLDGPQQAPVNTVPALWAAELPLIIVGATDVSGREYKRQQNLSGAGPYDDIIYAPGEVRCAGPGDREVARRGTSSAAGMVAGLVAYLPNRPERAFYVRLELIVNYTRRVLGGLKGPKVIWNGFGRNDGPDSDLALTGSTNLTLQLPTNITGSLSEN